MTYFLIFCHICLLVCEIAFTIAIVWVGFVTISSCYDSEKKIKALEAQVKVLQDNKSI